MKKLEAIIRPAALQAVKDALAQLGIDEMTVSEVKRCGSSEGRTEMYRGAEYILDSTSMKIEVVLDDRLAENAVRIVRSSAGSERREDGLIVLSPVDQVIGSPASQHEHEPRGHRVTERRHYTVPERSIPRNGAVLTFKTRGLAESAN
jgi:nitrogen regulatory protein PII